MSEKELDAAVWEPNTDIIETEDEVVLKLELAGIAPEALCIRMENGRIIISGFRKENRPLKDHKYHQLEMSYGQFLKVIPLPDEMEHNDTTAVLKNGILEINISKKSEIIEIPINFDDKKNES
ncbi:Hsp20/alpha crystallin family protein [candidate division KSB1 bacterium]|nr:Hsp20/alpha crystallin family protein [candidate division KSB1 bacterium]